LTTAGHRRRLGIGWDMAFCDPEVTSDGVIGPESASSGDPH